jgi:hypothetical protein
MISNEDIKTFVQQTLGCACPEEIFNHIECQSNIKLADNIVLSNKINIGGRLLIYIIEVNNPDSIKYILPSILSTGQGERDRLNFNRFRLVLAVDSLNEIKHVVDFIFNNKDERIHLHIVSKDNFPRFLLNAASVNNPV